MWCSDILDAGGVRARAEASAGHALHLVEGHQLSLREEDQTGDEIPQRRRLHDHAGEDQRSWCTTATSSHIHPLFSIELIAALYNFSFHLVNIKITAMQISFTFSEILRGCVLTAVCSKNKIILFSTHALLMAKHTGYEVWNVFPITLSQTSYLFPLFTPPLISFPPSIPRSIPPSSLRSTTSGSTLMLPVQNSTTLATASKTYRRSCWICSCTLLFASASPSVSGQASSEHIGPKLILRWVFWGIEELIN